MSFFIWGFILRIYFFFQEEFLHLKSRVQLRCQGKSQSLPSFITYRMREPIQHISPTTKRACLGDLPSKRKLAKARRKRPKLKPSFYY